jgi:hypothetical protein
LRRRARTTPTATNNNTDNDDDDDDDDDIFRYIVNYTGGAKQSCEDVDLNATSLVTPGVDLGNGNFSCGGYLGPEMGRCNVYSSLNVCVRTVGAQMEYDTHTHARTHAPTHSHTHPPTHARTHARTRVSRMPACAHADACARATPR